MKRITWSIVMGILCLPSCFLSVALAGVGREIPTAPFEPGLYALGYEVFLANKNPGDAFAVAEKAVSVLPGDPVWRRRAARSAEWSGRPDRALVHWSFLASSLSDAEAQREGLRLARLLRDFKALKELLRPQVAAGREDALKEYVAACESIGRPEEAIEALETQRRGANGMYALEQLARLYEKTGRPGDAIAALSELATRYDGIKASLLLSSASLAYGRGDIMAAYKILNLGKATMPSDEHEYWGHLSDLDWALQDTDGAVQASRRLVERGKGREVDYQRLIFAAGDADEKYRLALQGWRKLKKDTLFMALLEAGTTLNRHKELLALASEPSAAEYPRTLEESSYFWSLMSGVYKMNGRIADSLRCYREALRRSPDDAALTAGFIWLLIELDLRKDLKEVLRALRGRESSRPELYEPLAAAYAHLSDYPKALRFFQARYELKGKDPDWLAAYADTLEMTGFPEAAFLERLRALRITRTRIKKGLGAGEEQKDLTRTFARLAMRIEPGDPVDRVVGNISQGALDDPLRELVAAWALSTERSDAARLWFWQKYAAMANRPRWIELSLALEINDTDTIERLLRDDLERLPYRDAIEASLRVGRRELSEQLAFDWAGTNPTDHLLYEQIREIFGSHPSFIRDRTTFSDRGGVGVAENTITLSMPVTRRWTFLAEGTQGVRGNLGSGAIGETPGIDVGVRMGIGYRMEKGESFLLVGGRSALESFPFVSGGLEYRPSSRWRILLGLRYSDYADETVPLRIGGTKDAAELSMEYRLTHRDILSGRVSVFAFHDQDRRRLGGGEAVELDYSYLFAFSYPDVRGRVFGGYSGYRRGGMPTGEILKLIPGGRAPDISFFVPESFGQAGLGFSFGQATRDAYSKEWRLFGAADFVWNSRASAGWRYEAGVHGPLFGLDKLYFSILQDSGSYGLSDMNTTLEIGYRYYLN